MTKGRATESQLGDLHNKVAQVMVNALDVVERAQDVYLDAPVDSLVDAVRPEVPATLLSVITKFLSDNKITCVPEEASTGNALQGKLDGMRARRKQVGNVVHMTEPE